MEQVISFSADNGNDYLIEFSKFNSLDHIKIPLINVNLVLTNENASLISFKSLIRISSIIEEYLSNHNVILYYYCDSKDIFRRDTRISPQQYRSTLFSVLFERSKREDFIVKNIIIKDNERGDHYICLITHKNNESYFDVLLNEVNQFK